MNFIDSDGYGNCLKRDHRFPNSAYSCYVEEPSECKDKLYLEKEKLKLTLKPDLGTTLSALACKGVFYNFV